MKIKIIKIIEKAEPFKPEGKNYTIYAWIIKANVNNQEKEITVKAFTNTQLNTGDEIEVQENEYKGKVDYRIVKEKSQGAKGWVRPSYTLDEYDKLFKHAYDYCVQFCFEIEPQEGMRAEILQRYVSTYLISATQAGIKIIGESNADITGGDSPEEAVKKVMTRYNFDAQPGKKGWINDEIAKGLSNKRAEELIGIIKGWGLKEVDGGTY